MNEILGIAIDSGGKIIDAATYDYDSWQILKSTYEIGDFKMLCCKANAIPKTSNNFVQFFAHQTDECATAPETIWHKTAKKMISDYLYSLALHVIEEKSGSDWRADVYFELGERKIAIELQRSSQTLDRYFKRQAKYKSDGIEAYWFLYQPCYVQLTKSIKKYRLKFEFGNIIPEGGFFPTLKELPILYFDEKDLLLKGACHFSHSIPEVLTAIMTQNFTHQKTWSIS